MLLALSLAGGRNRLRGNIHVLRKHKGGREGVSQMLTFAYRGGGAKGSCLRNHSLEKMLNSLHQLFQGKRKSLESFHLCTVWNV